MSCTFANDTSLMYRSKYVIRKYSFQITVVTTYRKINSLFYCTTYESISCEKSIFTRHSVTQNKKIIFIKKSYKAVLNSIYNFSPIPIIIELYLLLERIRYCYLQHHISHKIHHIPRNSHSNC